MLSLAYEVQRECHSIFSHQLWRKKATDDLFSPVLYRNFRLLRSERSGYEPVLSEQKIEKYGKEHNAFRCHVTERQPI